MQILINLLTCSVVFSWISFNMDGCSHSGHCRKHMKVILNVSTGRSIIKAPPPPVPLAKLWAAACLLSLLWSHWGNLSQAILRGPAGFPFPSFTDTGNIVQCQGMNSSTAAMTLPPDAIMMIKKRNRAIASVQCQVRASNLIAVWQTAGLHGMIILKATDLSLKPVRNDISHGRILFTPSADSC